MTPEALREVPGPNSQQLKRDLLDHEVGGTYWRTTFDGPDRIPVVDSQVGIYVTDVDGNQYIETYGAFAMKSCRHGSQHLR